MRSVIEFLAGRNNKLLRDMLGASAVVALVCVAAVGAIRSTVDSFVAARQSLPSRLDASRSGGNGPIITITRSVLDEPVFTGSVSGKSVVLDPCTGKEKK